MKTSHTTNGRNPIGFKVTDNKLAVYQPEPVNNVSELDLNLNIEQLMKIKGREQALMVLNEYFDNYMYPLLNGDKRDEFFIGRLRQIRERFFAPLR